MYIFRFFINLALIVTVPISLIYPQNIPMVTASVTDQPFDQKVISQELSGFTYEKIIQLIEDLASGELQEKASFEDLNRLNQLFFFLAKKGVSSQERYALERDIEELTSGFESASFMGNLDSSIAGINYNWFNKCWRKTKSFVKKHKKEIIVGTVVVVAVVIVVIAIIATSGTAAGAAAAGGSASGGGVIGGVGAAGAGVAGVFSDTSDKSDTSHPAKQFDPSITKQPIEIPSIPYPFNSPSFSTDAPLLSSIIDKQTSSFQGKLNNDQFFPPSTSERLSWEETGNVLAPIVAHHSYQELQKQLPNSPQLVQELQKMKEQMPTVSPNLGNELAHGHLGIDQIFSINNLSIFSAPLQGQSFESHVYKSIGEKAFDFGYHQQAAESFGKALVFSPTDSITYLQRGASYFHLGDYEKSMSDFHSYVEASTLSKTIEPFVLSEFTRGFSKGFPKGIYESGEGIALFLSEFISHPIHTSGQVMKAFSTLAKLVVNDEFGELAKMLTPEVYELAKNWETIPSDKRGELAGYALGKHGTDILAPGALLKVTKSGISVAKEVTAVCKNLNLARETLLLETATGMGSSVQLGEVVSAAKTTAFLGEELGFTAKEMGQLKKAGKLDGAIDQGLDKLVAQSESEIFKAAIKNDKHVKTVRDYLLKPAKEIQKGIHSFEKQIAKHQDKIKNPSKHCPGWDNLRPERKNSLINKKWPTEVKGFEEQKKILRSILDERMN